MSNENDTQFHWLPHTGELEYEDVLELQRRATRLDAMQAECTERFPTGPFPGTGRPATCRFGAYPCEKDLCPLINNPHPDAIREYAHEVLRELRERDEEVEP